MKYSVCLEFFFKDLPLEHRVAKVKELGVDSGEIWYWQNRDLKSLRKALDNSDFELVCLCAMEPEPGLVDPANHKEMHDLIRRSMDAADTLGCHRMIVMAGNTRAGQTRASQWSAVVDGLGAVAEEARRRGIILLLEVLDSSTARPGFFLDNTDEMFSIVKAVGNPAVRALYDIYHIGLTEGNHLGKIRDHVDLIGHFHVAGVPARNEPYLGDIHYPAIVGQIQDLGFEGYVGLEYTPSIDSAQSLRRSLRWLAAKPAQGETS